MLGVGQLLNLIVLLMNNRAEIIGRYHPDKNASNPEASELFKEVAYSYNILSDPEKRRQYDMAGFEVHYFFDQVKIPFSLQRRS